MTHGHIHHGVEYFPFLTIHTTVISPHFQLVHASLVHEIDATNRKMFDLYILLSTHSQKSLK